MRNCLAASRLALRTPALRAATASTSTKSISAAATVRSARCADRCDGRPKRRRQFRKTRASSYPFLADAGSCPGNCSGTEKRPELQAHSRFGNRGGCGLPVATRRRS